MPCTFTPGPIPGLMIIQPKVFSDNRGWFTETYKQSEFISQGITETFVQDNHSYSVQGTLRGLHFQTSPHAQGKLVRCIRGKVWDVAVDLRKNSPTFGQYFGIELSEENQTLFYIPPGFAHGFLTLSQTAEFTYKVTAEYAAQYDGGIRYNDPMLNISWPDPGVTLLVSPKDATLPCMADLPKDFCL